MLSNFMNHYSQTVPRTWNTSLLKGEGAGLTVQQLPVVHSQAGYPADECEIRQMVFVTET